VWAVGEYYKGGGWKALAENWDGSSWTATTMPDELTGNEVGAVTYDVQLEPPNSAQFTTFAVGVTASTGSFTPSSGAGTYRFEARLRNISTGASSSWSPPRSISVTN